MSVAHWMNRSALDTVLNDKLKTLGFLLSTDTPDALRERLETPYRYTNANYKSFWREYYRKVTEGTEASTPGLHHTDPVRLEVTAAGRLRLVWDGAAGGVLFPRTDGYQAEPEAPVKTFAVWLSDFGLGDSYTYFWEKLEAYSHPFSTSLMRRGRGWLVGTVGPHGSGADLELEGIESWRLGQPLYVPGNQLEFPLELVRGMPGAQPVPEPESSYTPMETVGRYRNIALLGTNGLTEESFTNFDGAGNVIPYDPDDSTSKTNAYRAFNGYFGPYSHQLLWPEAADNPSGLWQIMGDAVHAVQVDFGRPVSGIVGFGADRGYDDRFGIRDLGWQASLDGTTFTELGRYDFENAPFHVRTLAQPITARYVRFLFYKNNRPSGTNWRSRVGNLSVYQAGSW